VDARTQKLLEERTKLLGSEMATPRTEYQRSGGWKPDRSAYQTPETANPDSTDLSYATAAQDREISQVQERLAGFAAAAQAGEPVELTLAEALRIAQESSREFRRAEEDYILAAIRLLIEQHRWGPRFFAETALSASGSASEGSFQHAIDIVNTLRATKRLPYGGQVEARLVWNATEQLRRTVSGRYRQSSELVLSANVPLLRGGGLVARESIIQSERDLVYAARSFERFRREFLVDIANDYFSLVESQQRIDNQIEQIRGFEQLYVQTKALADAGQARQFQVQLTESRVLSAKSALANLEESYRLQLDRFRVRIGLPLDQPVRIAKTTIVVPEPDATLEQATQAALLYRLDLQNQRDAVEDEKRAVEVARNQLLPDLNLAGNVSVPTDPDVREGGFGIDVEEMDYAASISLDWPLDREIERLNLRSALIGYERQQRSYEQFRDNVIIEARQSLRNIELARFRFELAKQQVEINELRRQEQEARQDEMDAQSRVDTQIELLDAQNARDQARTDLQVAVLRYLLQTGQLRVGRDGWIAPPEGMPEVIEELLPEPGAPGQSGDEQPIQEVDS